MEFFRLIRFLAWEEPDKSGVMGDCAESFGICSGDAPEP